MDLIERKDTKTGAPLGIVDKDGTVRFASDDINECRDFLRGRGLAIGPRSTSGWRKEGWTETWLGLIEFWNGKWHAAAWRTDVVFWTGDSYAVRAR